MNCCDVKSKRRGRLLWRELPNAELTRPGLGFAIVNAGFVEGKCAMTEITDAGGGCGCFKKSDLIQLDGLIAYSEFNGVHKIAGVSGTTLTIRPLYWHERIWERLRVEIADAFPFLFWRCSAT